MSDSITSKIFNALGGKNGDYYGETFFLTEKNKVTQLDTPGLWNHNPTVNNYWSKSIDDESNFSKSNLNLLQAIEDTVANAENYLDITTLWHTSGPHGGFPSGTFANALRRGFRRMAATGKKPKIRIMVGLPIGVLVSTGDMNNWLNKLIHIDWDITVYIANNHPQIVSWNHSKIVAADGKVAIVGGHNMWHASYMSFAPIHDISVKMEGDAVIGAHQFCNRIWTKPMDPLKWYKHKYKRSDWPIFSNFPDTTPGNTRSLSLGRLGAGIAPSLTINSNASVFGRVTAILNAKKEIRISQQGLGFLLNNIGNFDVPTMAALAKAIHNGVAVFIVVSNDGAKDGSGAGYAGSSIFYQCGVLAAFIEKELTDGFPPASDPVAYMNLPEHIVDVNKYKSGDSFKFSKATSDLFSSAVYFASLRFSEIGGPWTDGHTKRIPGNHAKLYIIDDTNFYVGSDNMYRSGTDHGLQEFGYLMEGQVETQKFISDYWDKLWMYSKMQRHTYIKE